MSRRISLIVLVALAIAPRAFAQDQLIFVKGGDVYRGEVLKSDAKTVTVKLSAEHGGTTHTVDADRFEPYFFYQVRDKALGDDVQGRIQLAKYAVDNGMFSRAKAQMDTCRALDPKAVEEFMKTEFPKIKEGLAARLLKAAQKALRVGSTKNAHKYASAILTKFGGTKVDAQATAILDQVQAKIDADQEKRRAQRRRSDKAMEEIEQKKETAKRDSMLTPVEKEIDAAEAANRRGLTGKNMSKQKSGFETAASKYKRAMKMANDYSTKTQEADLIKALAEMAQTGKDGAVQAYLNLANLYSSRGNYVKGTEYCNMALAIDPNNAEAKSARAVISTTNGGWGGRRGGRRR